MFALRMGAAAALAAGSLLAAGLSAPALAAETPSVTVPRHVSDGSSIQLYGVADAGLVVRQGSNRLLVGAEGGGLALQGTAARPDFTLVGNRMSRFTQTYRPDTDTTVYGTDVFELGGPEFFGSTGTMQPVAATASGYLGLDGSTLKNYGTGTTLITGVDQVTGAASDRDGTLIAYQTVDADGARQHVALITLTGATPKVEQVAAPDFVAGTLGLSGSTLAWITSSADGEHQVLYRRARSGGVTSAAGADLAARQYGIAVAGDRVAWYAEAHTIAIIGPASSRVVTVPGTDINGVKAAGDSFYVGVSGLNSEAGVYKIGTGAATRVGTVSGQPATISGFALSSGTLTYADDAHVAKPGLDLWRRTVSGTAAPRLSAPGLLAPRVASATDRPLSFSAGRGVIVSPNDRIQLVDRGRVTATLPISGAHAYKASGPYLRVDGRIYTSAGRLVTTVPAADRFRGVDLYGAFVAYSAADGAIWLRDLRKPGSPTKVADACTGSCSPAVAIWGNLIAYQTGTSGVALKNLTTGAIGKVAFALGSNQLRYLQLTEGTVRFGTQSPQQVNSEYVAPFETRTGIAATPIPLARLTTDGHWAAGLTPAGDLVVQRLPFGGRQVARLIGSVAAGSFSPNGDGRADTWAPQFDTSKALAGVVLTIRSGSRVIRTLKASTAPDGSIRNLSWNGLTSSGARAANGRYTWRLTAQTADGEGSLRGTDGRAAVTGSVRLAR